MKYYEIAIHCIKLKIFGDGVHWPGCQSIPVSVAFHAATFTNIIVVVVVVWSCESFKTHPDVKQFGDTKEDPIHQIYSDANIQVRLPFLGTPETYQARQSWPPQNWLIIDVRTPVEVWRHRIWREKGGWVNSTQRNLGWLFFVQVSRNGRC